MFIINAFCSNVPVGEYSIPKHLLKNGVVIAENLIKIGSDCNLSGITQFCPVLALNVSNSDVFLSDNYMLGTIIKHYTNEVESETFLCTVNDSIEIKQNLNPIASGSSKSLNNERLDCCEEEIAVNKSKVKVDDFKTGVKASERERMSSHNNNAHN